MKKTRNFVTVVCCLLMIMLFLGIVTYEIKYENNPEIPYDQFVVILKSNEFEKIELYKPSNRVIVYSSGEKFQVTIPNEDELSRLVYEYENIELYVKHDSSIFWDILILAAIETVLIIVGCCLVGIIRLNRCISYHEAVYIASKAIVEAIIKPINDDKFSTQCDLNEQMQCLYAGRAAEEVILKTLSTKAVSDLNEACQIAYKMVNWYGMNESGNWLVKIGKPDFDRRLNSNEAIEKICQENYDQAKKIVAEHTDLIKELAKKLGKYRSETKRDEEIESFLIDYFEYFD